MSHGLNAAWEPFAHPGFQKAASRDATWPKFNNTSHYFHLLCNHYAFMYVCIYAPSCKKIIIQKEKEKIITNYTTTSNSDSDSDSDSIQMLSKISSSVKTTKNHWKNMIGTRRLDHSSARRDSKTGCSTWQNETRRDHFTFSLSFRLF